MPSPDAPLDSLIDQLDSLGLGDRRAILARLSPEQRRKLRARHDRTQVAAQPASPFSPDIAERITSTGGPKDAAMTPAGRAALARVLAADSIMPQPATPVSLLDTVLNLLRPRRSAAP